VIVDIGRIASIEKVTGVWCFNATFNNIQLCRPVASHWQTLSHNNINILAGRWISPGTPVFSTNKTDCQDITDILLKKALSTMTPIPLSKTIQDNNYVQQYSVMSTCCKSLANFIT
jgi:hypothetical protein